MQAIPATRTQVMLNLANPAAALRWWRLPADGVGLARMEFVINSHIKVHPMALVRYDDARPTRRPSAHIDELTRGYADRTEYFVERLAARTRPHRRRAVSETGHRSHQRFQDQRIRESDRRARVRAHRGESDDRLPWSLALLLASLSARASRSNAGRLRRLRDQMGFRNVIVMIPFCRSIRRSGSRARGHGGERSACAARMDLQIYVMCEIPSNVILADGFRQPLRRILDRQQRPDTAHARRGS